MDPPMGLFNAAESLASSSSLVSHLMGMGDREQVASLTQFFQLFSRFRTRKFLSFEGHRQVAEKGEKGRREKFWIGDHTCRGKQTHYSGSKTKAKKPSGVNPVASRRMDVAEESGPSVGSDSSESLPQFPHFSSKRNKRKIRMKRRRNQNKNKGRVHKTSPPPSSEQPTQASSTPEVTETEESMPAESRTIQPYRTAAPSFDRCGQQRMCRLFTRSWTFDSVFVSMFSSWVEHEVIENSPCLKNSLYLPT